MSKERQSQSKAGYHSNKMRLYEIYNIEYTDRNFDCHHIVTKKDKRTHVVPSYFNLNEISNLHPIDKRLHKLVTKIIEALDNGQEIDVHAEIEKKMKLISEKSEIISRKTVEVNNSVYDHSKELNNQEKIEYIRSCLDEENLDEKALAYYCSARLDLVTN